MARAGFYPHKHRAKKCWRSSCSKPVSATSLQATFRNPSAALCARFPVLAQGVLVATDIAALRD